MIRAEAIAVAGLEVVESLEKELEEEHKKFEGLGFFGKLFNKEKTAVSTNYYNNLCFRHIVIKRTAYGLHYKCS